MESTSPFSPAPGPVRIARPRPQGADSKHLGDWVANTFELVAVVEERRYGTVYRASHPARPEPFHVYLMNPGLARADAVLRYCREQAKKNGLGPDLLQEGHEETTQQTFLAWPVKKTVPEPIAF